jgi:Bacterial regulatory proteins, luxR family
MSMFAANYRQTNARIARTPDIGAGTVRKHVEHILCRLEVPSRTAAAVRCITGSAPQQASSWTAALASVTSPSG